MLSIVATNRSGKKDHLKDLVFIKTSQLLGEYAVNTNTDIRKLCTEN